MSARIDLLFLDSPRFGKLFYHNVYSYYDEPLIFSALNEYDQLFFCYSLGCDENHDRWIIVPISQDLINRLEQKDISVVRVIQQNTTSKVFLVKIDLENFTVNEEHVLAKKLPFKLPKDDYYIRENVNYDGTRKHSHKIRIANVLNKSIVSETLNKASEAFGDFCRHFLKKHDLSVYFYPQDAIPGSFVYRVKTKTKDDEQFKSTGYEVLSTVNSKNKFLDALDNKEIDLRVVRKLFDIISSNNLAIQFIEEESTETIFEISSSYVNDLIPNIDDKLGTYLDSSMVPQADNLDTLKRYLHILDDKKIVTAETLGISERQVSYYRDACQILGLIHNYSSLTPWGIKAVEADDELFIEIIKKQFENSDCGYLWMIEQQVSSILDINEESAFPFLLNNCNGLSEGTSYRRAQTLKSWVLKFKEYS